MTTHMSHFKEDRYIRISVYVISLPVFSLLCPGQNLVSGSQKRATQISDTSLILFFLFFLNPVSIAHLSVSWV